VFLRDSRLALDPLFLYNEISLPDPVHDCWKERVVDRIRDLIMKKQWMIFKIIGRGLIIIKLLEENGQAGGCCPRLHGSFIRLLAASEMKDV
jgi:hypothetical protein